MDAEGANHYTKIYQGAELNMEYQLTGTLTFSRMAHFNIDLTFLALHIIYAMRKY